MQSPPLAGISFPHVSHTPESILCFLPNVLIIKELPFAAAVFEIQERWNTPWLSLPITERLADEELSLPISPCLTQEQAEYVVNLLNDFMG